MEHYVFGCERDIGFKLCPPVTVEALQPQQVLLRATNRFLDLFLQFSFDLC
jgi:hypothetical protein